MHRISIGLVLTAVIALAGPANATAATRYAAPSGSGGGACAQTDPCPLAQAILAASTGDTVLVGPGAYDISSQADMRSPAGLTVIGEGSPAPLITSSSPAGL